MNNSERFVHELKVLEAQTFFREELFPSDTSKYSPYFSYAVRAEILERLERGRYRKTALCTEPEEELVKLMTSVQQKSNSPLTSIKRRRNGMPTAPPVDQPMEFDLYEVLDQLPIEGLLDVIAAKWNYLAAQAEPLKREVNRLQDQLAIKENEIKSLKVEALRTEEKQKKLNHENDKLTALFSTTKKDRLVLAKPVNAAGTVTFKDEDRKTIKIYRKA